MPPAKPLFRWKTSGTADERSWDADESMDSHGLKELHPTRARAWISAPAIGKVKLYGSQG